MAKHLTEAGLLAAADGLEDPAERAHLEACPACREALSGLRDGLDLARRASGVPEPSPQYWDSFRLQVERRIAAEAGPSWRALVWARFGLASLVPAVAVAVLLIAFGPVMRSGAGGAGGPAPLLPAWQALPAAPDDAGLEVLQGLALQGTDLQAAAECHSVVECVGDLDDEDSQALADALRKEIPEGRS
jgi:hypothetical protein